MFVMMGISGIGLAATYIAPMAMIPDTIEYDKVRSGLREEGVYYGLWTFFSKSGQALAGLIGGLVLQIVRYIPIETAATRRVDGMTVQAPEAITGIRLLLGPIPALFLIVSAIIVLSYPISEKVYKEIMAGKK
jgi:GPH family glycoside/pentoside/hexuronide:cation symporter